MWRCPEPPPPLESNLPRPIRLANQYGVTRSGKNRLGLLIGPWDRRPRAPGPSDDMMSPPTRCETAFNSAAPCGFVSKSAGLIRPLTFTTVTLPALNASCNQRNLTSKWRILPRRRHGDGRRRVNPHPQLQRPTEVQCHRLQAESLRRGLHARVVLGLFALVACVLDQDFTTAPPTKSRPPDVVLRDLRHPAQSESLYASIQPGTSEPFALA